MTELEFEIMDELYFIISYQHLLMVLDLKEDEIKNGLKTMIEKKWVKCFYPENHEVDPENVNFDKNYSRYYYLATKSGLFAHNSI